MSATPEELNKMFSDLDMLEARVGDIFIHFKQLTHESAPKHAYQVIAISLDADTLEPLITYRDSTNYSRFWTRKASSFFGTTEVDGKQVPRFHYLGWAEPPSM